MTIIQRIEEPQLPIVQGERDFARIQKKPYPKRPHPYYFLNTETQEKYSWLEGAFAPPGHQYPGFAVIIGLDREKHPTYGEHIIRVLEEFETEKLADIKGLIKGCVALKQKYGVYPLLQQGFYTELDEPSSDRVYNIISKLYGEKSEFWPVPGAYSNVQTQSFDYREYLITLAHYKRILHIGQAAKLKAYILMVRDGKDLLHLKPQDNPAIAAIAYAVSALVAKKPWQFQQEDGVWELEDEY